MTEQEQAKLLRRGLDLIDTLPRRRLLRALDRESAKDSTKRLRTVARLRWIAGEIHELDLWPRNDMGAS